MTSGRKVTDLLSELPGFAAGLVKRHLIGFSGQDASVPIRIAQDNPFRTRTVAIGLISPTSVAQGPDGYFYVTDQPGQLYRLHPDIVTDVTKLTPFLSLTDKELGQHGGLADERGLLQIIFPPENDVTFMLWHTAPPSDPEKTDASHDLVLDQWNMTTGQKVGEIVRFVNHPVFNHNGSVIGFDPHDANLLYLALGDGGGLNDKYDTAQYMNSPYGKVWAIDLTKKKKKRLVSLGHRNPWRGFVHSQSGMTRLIIGEVGESDREGVISVWIGGNAIENHGWPAYENGRPTDKIGQLGGRDPVKPLLWYSHHLGSAIILGPWLPDHGALLIGDFTGLPGFDRLMLATSSQKNLEHLDGLVLFPVRAEGEFLHSFGTGRDGQIYMLTSRKHGPMGRSGTLQALDIQLQ